MPTDSNKLRLSKKAFHYLIYRLEIAPAFLFALSRYFLPTGRGYRQFPLAEAAEASAIHHYWYFLPVRVQVWCTDQEQSHAAGFAGSNQMNPFHYLHLAELGMDIRGSQIALYARYNTELKSSFVLAVSLLDGRWQKAVEQPQSRIEELLRTLPGGDRYLLETPFFYSSPTLRPCSSGGLTHCIILMTINCSRTSQL